MSLRLTKCFMRIRFTSRSTKEVGPVLGGVCHSLQKEFEEWLKDVDISQILDEIAVIVTVVDDAPEVYQCLCITPASVSSTENFVTGEKAKVLTIRLSIRPTFVLQNSAEVIRNRILSEITNVISSIRTKRILVLFDQGRFVELVRSKRD